MFVPKTILAAMLFLLLVRSADSSTSTTVATPSATPSLSPSASSSTAAGPSVTASSDASSTATPAPSNTPAGTTATPAPNNTPAGTTTTAPAAGTSTAGGGSQGGQSVTPTSAALMSSVSVADVVWTDWTTEKDTDCKEKCCDTGGPVIKQIRTCVINKPRCNLTECTNYGVVERDISCHTACSQCMTSGSAGYAPGFITIIATLIISAIVTWRP